MRFEEKEPEHKLLISDGKWVTEYKVGLQAEQTPVKKSDDERLQLFQIPWNPEWQTQFKKTEGPRSGERPVTATNRLVRLIPNKDKEIPEILLEVDPATFLIH